MDRSPSRRRERQFQAQRHLVRFLLSLAIASGGAFAALPAAAEVSVRDAWVRATVGKIDVTAGYATIVNAGPVTDQLLSVSSSAAGSIELHKTTNGVMSMEPVGTLVIPPNGRVDLSPGGYHLMVMGLSQPLKVGETVDLIFTFKAQGAVKVTAKVAPLSARHGPE